MTTRGACGQYADVLDDHPAGRLEVADLDAPTQHALHVGGRAFREGADRARVVQADGVAVERRDERRRCMAATPGGWPIIARSRTARHRRPRPVVAAGICVPSCVWCDTRHRASRPVRRASRKR
ncbi:hypothetical protein WT97_14325 [Burkholderia sp. MSMB1459WGS]|nr:hypothetical protein WT97_14325 [Burkholderia sp. MSMB1459WGS]